MGETAEKVDGLREVLNSDAGQTGQAETTPSATPAPSQEGSQASAQPTATAEGQAPTASEAPKDASAPQAQPAPAVTQTAEQKMVPLQALAATRAKLKEAQERLRQYEQPYPNTFQEPEHQTEQKVKALESKVETTRLSLSESNARRNHSDYQEKYALFEAEVVKELETSALTNPDRPVSPLYQQILQSEDPAEAIYQYAKVKQFQQKYGADVDSQYKNIKAEIEKELRPKITQELEANLAGKIAQKNNNPTNILATGTSTGNGSDGRAIGWGEALASRRMR